MEIYKTIGEQMAAARQLEQAGRLSEAATLYQKLFDSDPGNQQVMDRLLVMYRKLKDYKKELSVLNDAIAAYQQRKKAARDKWIKSNPKAARAGRSMLRQLEKGQDAMMGLGDDPMIGRWIKRKEIVTSRITGKKIKRVAAPAEKKKVVPMFKKVAPVPKKMMPAPKKLVPVPKKLIPVLKKLEPASNKLEVVRPSLFIIILRYLVSLDKIDTTMKQHMAYLNKHYANGDFLVSGRQVPRTGGIILAHGKDRNAIERIIKQDPFLKRRLASADIIEFTPSQSAKGLNLPTFAV